MAKLNAESKERIEWEVREELLVYQIKNVSVTDYHTQVLRVPGRVFKLGLDGKVIGAIGKAGRNLKQFSGAHALACPSETEIYVAESSNWRVQKIVLRAARATASSR